MSTFSTSAAALAASATFVLTACSGMSPMAADMTSKPFSQNSLPDAVKVPAGHVVAMETVGVGEITYECRAKPNTAGAFEWAFVGPLADLRNRSGVKVGTYFGPPATWALTDGTKITGTQVAVAPLGTGNIPAQLVKTNPPAAPGAMAGVGFIQRVATQGGVAPASTCDGNRLGQKEVVKYQADYVFWKAV